MVYGLIRLLQKLMKAQNLTEKPSTREEKNGRLILHDVSYGSKYPNHFLDIYLVSPDTTVRRPTLFYVHGGGYTWGSKITDGDKGGFAWYFERFLQAGYNVVSMDYVFAPEYQYPTPILQMGEAIRFLQAHSEYGVSLEQVVFCGCSAGGQLIGQFANIETNPAYAKDCGIRPVLGADRIKAVVFHSSLLDMEKFGEVDSKAGGSLFIKCGEAYFGIPKRWPDSNHIQQARVTANFTAAFPPCYISDANFNSFTKQAVELDQVCNDLGIRHMLHLVPIEETKLNHGYEDIESEYSKKNMELVLEFLRSLD